MGDLGLGELELAVLQAHTWGHRLCREGLCQGHGLSLRFPNLRFPNLRLHPKSLGSNLTSQKGLSSHRL